jgi:hypothetical protein
MNIHLRISALCAAVPLLAAMVCIPPEPPPPPLLKAPRFTGVTVTEYKVNDMHTELVYLEWAPPDSGAASVSEYVIIQRLPIDTGSDTLGLLSSEPQKLPSEKTYAYQITENIRRYAQEARIITLGYRIFAIDNMDRSSDTSEEFSVSLLKTVELKTPADTLSENIFAWEFTGIPDEIFSNMILWNSTDSLPVFVSDTMSDFGFTYDPLEFSATLPQELFPLPADIYTWVVRTELPQPYPGATSYTIGTFRVP